MLRLLPLEVTHSSFELQHRLSEFHIFAVIGQEPGDLAAAFRPDRAEDFHGLDDEEFLPFRNLIAGFDERRRAGAWGAMEKTE